MERLVYDVIIVGAGHAGLSLSYFLQSNGIDHVVLERGRIGETWRTQRWDSFRMNTANQLNHLPGDSGPDEQDPDAFSDVHALIRSYQSNVQRFNLPVIQGANVTRVYRDEREEHFRIQVDTNHQIQYYTASQVVVASGMHTTGKVPDCARMLSQEIIQMHAIDYRNPGQLPSGNVLVVGSGQTGCQLTEELLQHGKTVYLSSSKVGRAPRRYRGKDIMTWLIQIGFFDLNKEDVTDPAILKMRTPQLSGIGPLGHTISLQQLSRMGAVILGSTDSIRGDRVFFRDNAADHVAFGDAFSGMCKQKIDAYILDNRIDASPPEIDEGDIPDRQYQCINSMPSLSLRDEMITSVIWCTGFGADFSYLQLPGFDSGGEPIHRQGVSPIPGLYFMGLNWQRTLKSGILFGINQDAAFIANEILQFKPITMSV